jgi:glycosyltransferase involved in cell wall biosynthesis
LVYPLNGRNKGQLFRVYTWIKAWRRLSVLNKEFDIKGIISFWCGECALVGSWFAKFHSLKHLCWISGQDAKKENKYVRWIRPSAYELVAMSDFLQQTFFRNHNIKPVHVIPPGIDERMFNNDAIEKDIDIIGVGSLIPLKQYEVFIEVIGELRKTLPNIKVVICGDGKERKRLKGLIDELGLDHNIQLVGEKNMTLFYH